MEERQVCVGTPAKMLLLGRSGKSKDAVWVREETFNELFGPLLFSKGLHLHICTVKGRKIKVLSKQNGFYSFPLSPIGGKSLGALLSTVRHPSYAGGYTSPLILDSLNML